MIFLYGCAIFIGWLLCGFLANIFDVYRAKLERDSEEEIIRSFEYGEYEKIKMFYAFGPFCLFIILIGIIVIILRYLNIFKITFKILSKIAKKSS